MPVVNSKRSVLQERAAGFERSKPCRHEARRWWIATGILLLGLRPCFGETLREALELAYRANPALNAQRASLGATGENLARTKAGYLPRVNAAADLGVYRDSTKPSAEDCSRPFVGDTLTNAGCDSFTTKTTPRGVGLQFNQNLFDGFRTTNSVRQARSQISAAQATTRNVEQNTLLLGVTAYVDMLADTAIVAAAAKNVAALQDQLQQTKARHSFGDVTKTDVAQIETRLAAAQAQHSLAIANLEGDAAAYRRVIGTAPHNLVAPREVSALVPARLEETVETSLAHNPAIHAARFGIEVALLQTPIIRSELLPNVSLTGSVIRRYDISGSGDERVAGAVTGQLSIPLYDGGDVAARARQSQFVSTQRRLEADQVRDEIRALAEKSWNQYQGARHRVASAQAQTRAATIAVAGIQSEWKFGERTLREVLDAQQDAVNARINLVLAQRDLVVSSFTVAQATGRLNLEELDRLDLTARQDSAFAIDRTRLSLKLWPRAGREESKLTAAPPCARDCHFANAWSLRGQAERRSETVAQPAAEPPRASLYDASARISAWRSAFPSKPMPGKSGMTM
ncbi:MAG: outer membrane protein [Bradyrhizobium sp.]|nr:outer membrane protein [Bradyrhizobium sp.]